MRKDSQSSYGSHLKVRRGEEILSSLLKNPISWDRFWQNLQEMFFENIFFTGLLSFVSSLGCRHFRLTSSECTAHEYVMCQQTNLQMLLPHMRKANLTTCPEEIKENCGKNKYQVLLVVGASVF